MNRRPLVLLALVVASFVASACSSVTAPTSKDDCKNGGWQSFNDPAFKNQGDCVSYVATKGKNKGNG